MGLIKPNCPRCDSTNTKFCYYNNYNKSQPRHFCKSCKRYWTQGGTLRNVPIGGCRKNKRLKPPPNFTQMEIQEDNTKKESCINGGPSMISVLDDHELQFPTPNFPCLNDQPWMYMESINSSWVWDDLDKILSSDVSVPWDDAEIN